MRSILCYLLFAIGGTVTYVCAEEKEQIGSDTLENILVSSINSIYPLVSDSRTL